MTYYPHCAVALSMGSRVEVRLPTVSNNCSPSANYSRLRAEEGEVSSEGRLLPFFCLSCDVTRNGMCSNGVLQSCYKPATNTWFVIRARARITNGALFEIYSKFVWSKCCYKPAINANLLFDVFTQYVFHYYGVCIMYLVCIFLFTPLLFFG